VQNLKLQPRYGCSIVSGIMVIGDTRTVTFVHSLVDFFNSYIYCMLGLNCAHPCILSSQCIKRIWWWWWWWWSYETL